MTSRTPQRCRPVSRGRPPAAPRGCLERRPDPYVLGCASAGVHVTKHVVDRRGPSTNRGTGSVYMAPQYAVSTSRFRIIGYQWSKRASSTASDSEYPPRSIGGMEVKIDQARHHDRNPVASTTLDPRRSAALAPRPPPSSQDGGDPVPLDHHRAAVIARRGRRSS